jgi:hypothetical protein
LVDSHKEIIEDYYDASVKYEDKVNHTPSILPVNGPISSPFGYRRNPFGRWTSEFHNGIDIACDYGTPLLLSQTYRYFCRLDGYWGEEFKLTMAPALSLFMPITPSLP